MGRSGHTHAHGPLHPGVGHRKNYTFETNVCVYKMLLVMVSVGVLEACSRSAERRVATLGSKGDPLYRMVSVFCPPGCVS